MLGPASWEASKHKKSYKRKKDMIFRKLSFVFMQKGTTFINTCFFSFDLEPTLLHTLHALRQGCGKGVS